MDEYTIVLHWPDGPRKHVDIEAPDDGTAAQAANIILRAEPPGTSADVLRWPSPAVH